MKALYKAGPQAGLQFVDRPEPTPGPDDVKIQVHTTGVCGTDIHIMRWDSWAQASVTAPLIPGHEFYGEVVEIGEAVTDIAKGDRVSGEGHIVCGLCRNCRAGRRHLCIRTKSVGIQRDGAFAQFVVIPQSNVWVHEPRNTGTPVTAELGAIFDPFGNAVHSALKFPVVGEDVLITGAGPIGLMAAAIARHAGARYITITDVSPSRLRLAEAMGVDLALNVSSNGLDRAVSTLGLKEAFDVGLEMSGRPTALAGLIEHMNHGGRVAILGLPDGPINVDWVSVVTRMLTIKGIYGREMFESWNAMAALLQNPVMHQRISSVITDVVPADQWEHGFDITSNGISGKVVLDWRDL